MSYRDRPRIWKTAYYLIADVGAGAIPCDPNTRNTFRPGDARFIEWAFDLRRLIPDEDLPLVDNHYLQPSNEYVKLPLRIRRPVKTMWRAAEKSGLLRQGLRIVEIVYG